MKPKKKKILGHQDYLRKSLNQKTSIYFYRTCYIMIAQVRSQVTIQSASYIVSYFYPTCNKIVKVRL